MTLTLIALTPAISETPALTFEEIFTRWSSYLETLQNYRCEFESERILFPNGKKLIESGEGEVISAFPKFSISSTVISDSSYKPKKIQLCFDGKKFFATDYSNNLSVGENISKMISRPDVENPIFLPFGFLYLQPASRFFSNELVSASSLPDFRELKISKERDSWRIQFVAGNSINSDKMKVSVEIDPKSLLPKAMSVMPDSGSRSELQVSRWAQEGPFTFPEEVIKREFSSNGNIAAEVKLKITSMKPFVPDKDGHEFRPSIELVREIIDTDSGAVIKPANPPAAEPGKDTSK